MFISPHTKLCNTKNCHLITVEIISPKVKWELMPDNFPDQYPWFPLVTEVIIKYSCGFTRKFTAYNANIVKLAATPYDKLTTLFDDEQIEWCNSKFRCIEEYYNAKSNTDTHKTLYP